MGIRIRMANVVYESVTMTAIAPNMIFPSVEKVKEYLKKHPFPEGSYTEEDLLADTQSEGMWTLPEDVTEEQKDYIVEMTTYFAENRRYSYETIHSSA